MFSENKNSAQQDINLTLLQLIPEEEIFEYSKLLKEGEVAIWTHWVEFVRKYLRIGRSIATIKNVRDTLRFIIRRLKIVSIDVCNSPFEFEDALYTEQAISHFSNTTFNTYLKNLATYLIWLEKREIIKENRLGKIDKRPKEFKEKLCYTPEEVHKIVAQIHSRRQRPLERARNACFVDFLRYTGARPIELERVTLEDVVPSQGSYVIKLKGAKQNGEHRHYRMPSPLRDSYESYLERRNKIRPNEKYLFISSSKQSRWTHKGGMTKLFKQLSKELKFNVTATAFRRYVATQVYSKIKNSRIVGDYLGHKREDTTMGYIGSSPSRTDEAGAVMEALLI